MEKITNSSVSAWKEYLGKQQWPVLLWWFLYLGTSRHLWCRVFCENSCRLKAVHLPQKSSTADVWDGPKHEFWLLPVGHLRWNNSKK